MEKEPVRMQLKATSAAGESLIAKVMGTVKHRIAARRLTPGARLPSIRSFALAMKVSKSTVVEAYERLQAEGVIRSRPGSGFFVAAPLAPLTLAEIGPRVDRAVDPLWISRQALEPGEGVLRPGCGWLPPHWMPEEGLRRALRGIARGAAATLVDYGAPLGLLPLRQLLTRRVAQHGIEASPDQILLTESGTQAIDLLCRFLLKPGDAVLVDDPCYFNFHALLRAHQARIFGVPYTPSGPDIGRFAEALAEHKPRLYITNSALHNPTGAMLSPLVGHRLLKLAEQAGLTIIEDDIFADFEETPAPRLAAFDGLERVVHIGSFSKTLSAAVRCGFIVAPRDWVEALTDLKIATCFGAAGFSSELVLTLLKNGSYRKHMETVRQRLAGAMAKTAQRLARIGVTPWIEPHAGMFLWCRLPDGIDAARLARQALARGIVLAPGNVFSHAQTASGFLRFNVAQSEDERLFRELAALTAAA
ncbi:aminotransferase-like domain-containing protein [Sinorhizobium meliloti]|uniref:Aminotransferase class I/II-fold pyridoxal phosphate-dependent enzyme n=1 Tax=Rhizobium meliloti TaxID=382 RepID=A0AAW9TPH2_RHIML|nr:PLP-dependent aminotransferase family protein [Sinorhizobium meliloti]MQW34536.1 aminotransferase class I/II-fold pyridoxal phosphate-dependent enzyme [Sinorhizobium meliloti]MQX30272.1 aminotransferase class I/II-fold pyridoxal phosphate-dependent enzyme [Sinorhizobium meliloti]QGJ77545.1 GntR family transcriptional regulator [Sinorhizobium meliloti]RVJ58621.1 PLP-dependent aminotransferase family protein [Sinorhizobium meliloti]RVK48681.1 PLP-dependent aminotransferase family protein [Sin